MKTAIVIFVKTPGYSALKTRLAKSIGKEMAELFHTLSVQTLEQKLQSMEGKGIQPIWAVAEEEALKAPIWKSFPSYLQAPGGLGERLFQMQNLVLKDFDSYIFLGADSPHISVESLLLAKDRLYQSGEFQIGLTTDGGYYLFASRQELPRNLWIDIPYSVETTAYEFQKHLQSLGKVNSDYPVLNDVDEVEDLRQFLQEMAKNDGIGLDKFKVFANLEV